MAEAGLSDFSYYVCSAPARVSFSPSVRPIRIRRALQCPNFTQATLRLIGDQVNAGPRVAIAGNAKNTLDVIFLQISQGS